MPRVKAVGDTDIIQSVTVPHGKGRIHLLLRGKMAEYQKARNNVHWLVPSNIFLNSWGHLLM